MAEMNKKLREKLKEIARQNYGCAMGAIEDAYPLIVEHVAKRDAEICEQMAREEFSVQRYDRTDRAMKACAEAIERELGGKE